MVSLFMKLKKLGVEIGRYMQENPIDTFFILFISLLVVIMASLYSRVDFDEANWEKFKTEHHCQIRFSNTGTQRASWVCDDGKTYFRWRQQR